MAVQVNHRMWHWSEGYCRNLLDEIVTKSWRTIKLSNLISPNVWCRFALKYCMYITNCLSCSISYQGIVMCSETIMINNNWRLYPRKTNSQPIKRYQASNSSKNISHCITTPWVNNNLHEVNLKVHRLTFLRLGLLVLFVEKIVVSGECQLW